MSAAAIQGRSTLASLLNDATLHALDDLSWSELQLDSRCVKAGDIFIALPGSLVNGSSFIDDCIEKEVAAILADAESSGLDACIRYQKSIPVIYVKNLSKKLSGLAGRALFNPSYLLDVVGVTGTNGKTTCSILTAQLLGLLGVTSSVIGTLGYAQLNDKAEWKSTGNTTPNAVDTQKILKRFLDAKVAAVVMEVSSHGLEQHRVSSVKFTTAVFTNLSHDHLDAHGTIENYGAIKARLLQMDDLQDAVINYDDPWARSLIEKSSHLNAVLTYSVESSDADVYLSELNCSESDITGVVHTPKGKGKLYLKLIGEFNASNSLAVISVALLRGYELNRILPLLEKLQAPVGRMQLVKRDDAQDIQVVIDYAHTPDALGKILSVLKLSVKGALWCVFGCGGDRDKDKRKMMGAISEAYADRVVLTEDNPRNEDSNEIIKNILSGINSPGEVLVCIKREEAINYAIQTALPGDTILIAGKGHENHQIIKGQRIEFSDEACSRKALSVRSEGYCSGKVS